MDFQSEYVQLALFGQQFQIRYYGLIIVTGMIIAAMVAARLAKRDHRDPEHIWGALTWAIIPGIILARLWFVLFPPVTLIERGMDTAWFLQNFGDLQNGPLAIWSGGLSIFGAVLGGFLGAYLYFSRWHNPLTNFISRWWWIPTGIIGILVAIAGITGQNTLATVLGILLVVIVALSFIPIVRRWFAGDAGAPFPDGGMRLWPWLDIAAVALPIGQAIGRWANYVNQELYGTVTTLPWGITIDSAHRVAPYTSTVEFPVATAKFHPLFLYESLWSILAFIVLLNIFLRYRNRLFPGDIFLLYVAQYAFIRFLLEFLRVEVAYLPGTTINSSQVATALAFIAALAFFFYRHRPGAVYVPKEDETAVHHA
ncbi:MAG: prolipoprotein diacylglyceryl transferase [Anaerolineaceae bacterium]|nr:prolipoprotein diacylglyceryl transferase [Anaerolineaceae bacterium]